MRLVFAGTPGFAERALSALVAAGHQVALVVTQPDRPAGRGLREVASPVKRFAEARGLALAQPPTLRSSADLERLRAVRPDALIVAAYGLILPPSVLEIARFGALNIHASLLPRWRGAAPIQRALLAGDRETGISIMQMDAGLDTGPVLARRAIAIEPQDDAASLHERLARLGADMIVEILADLPGALARAEPQPSEGVTYAHKIDKGETWIDWTRRSCEIERMVRAFRPAPGACTRLGEEVIKIWRASEAHAALRPGEVAPDADALLVGCGEGALSVTELQRAGGRRVSAAQYLRGRALAPGGRFG